MYNVFSYIVLLLFCSLLSSWNYDPKSHKILSNPSKIGSMITCITHKWVRILNSQIRIKGDRQGTRMIRSNPTIPKCPPEASHRFKVIKPARKGRRIRPPPRRSSNSSNHLAKTWLKLARVISIMIMAWLTTSDWPRARVAATCTTIRTKANSLRTKPKSRWTA